MITVLFSARWVVEVPLLRQLFQNKYIAFPGFFEHVDIKFVSRMASAAFCQDIKSKIILTSINDTYITCDDYNKFGSDLFKYGSITLMLIPYAYKQYAYFSIGPKECPSINIYKTNYACNQFTHFKGNIKKQYYYYHFEKNRHRYKGISWNKASFLCRKIGGHLPLLTGKEQTEELVALFKFYENLRYVQGIYIGLKYNKVCSHKYLSHKNCNLTF